MLFSSSESCSRIASQTTSYGRERTYDSLRTQDSASRENTIIIRKAGFAPSSAGCACRAFDVVVEAREDVAERGGFEVFLLARGHLGLEVLLETGSV